MIRHPLLLVAAVGLATPAAAQEVNFDWGQIQFQTTQAHIGNLSVEETARQARENKARVDDGGFVSTPTSRKAAFEAHARQNATANIAPADVDAKFRSVARLFGLRADNAIDALTAYFVLGWLIVSGADTPQPVSIRAARDDFAARLVRSPGFADAGVRQQLGEEMKLKTAILFAGIEPAHRAKAIPRYRDEVARRFLRDAKADLRALRLTTRGFVR